MSSRYLNKTSPNYSQNDSCTIVFEFLFLVTVCFQVAASHESNKTDADKTSNVIKTQTSEGQETETSCEEKMDYQQRSTNQMDETGPESYEMVPQEQQETEELMDTSDDAVVVTREDVPSKTNLILPLSLSRGT